MDLRAPLAMARKLIDKIYDPERPELATQRSASWRMAIVSFLPDDLAIPILGKLKSMMDDCKPVSDDLLERMAYAAENAKKSPPQWPLKYGRVIGSLPAASHIQFNSIKMGNFQPNYGLPVTPPGNPYVDTYPPLPPLVDSNLATIRAAIMRPMPIFQPAAVGAGYDQQAAAAQELLALQQAEMMQLAEMQAAANVLRTPQQQRMETAISYSPMHPGAQATIGTPDQMSKRQQLVDSAKRNIAAKQAAMERTADLTASIETEATMAAESASPKLPTAGRETFEVTGEVDVDNVTTYDRVFIRDGVMYAEIGGANGPIFRVLQSGDKPAEKQKKGTDSPTMLTRMQKRLNSIGKLSAENEQLVQLSSMNLQPDWVEKQAIMEKRQECLLEKIEFMSMSLNDMKRGQEEAKRLARASTPSVPLNGAIARDRNRDRSLSRDRNAVPRDRNRDGSVPRDRNEPYRRGSVSDGRYSSRERVPRDRNLDQRSGNSPRDKSYSRDRTYSSGPRDKQTLAKCTWLL